jgi:hypothetical protein
MINTWLYVVLTIISLKKAEEVDMSACDTLKDFKAMLKRRKGDF